MTRTWMVSLLTCDPPKATLNRQMLSCVVFPKFLSPMRSNIHSHRRSTSSRLFSACAFQFFVVCLLRRCVLGHPSQFSVTGLRCALTKRRSQVLRVLHNTHAFSVCIVSAVPSCVHGHRLSPPPLPVMLHLTALRLADTVSCITCQT